MALNKPSMFSQSQPHATSWSESHSAGRRDLKEAKVTALNSGKLILLGYFASFYSSFTGFTVKEKKLSRPRCEDQGHDIAWKADQGTELRWQHEVRTDQINID